MIENNTKIMIVKALQKGLSNSKDIKNLSDLKVNNNKWNENMNCIFTELLNIQELESLKGFVFKRNGFDMVGIYDQKTKTVFVLLSKLRFENLQKRKNIDKPHYTDAFSYLSKEPLLQTDMFNETKSGNNNEIAKLLNLILEKVELNLDVEKFAILEYQINHSKCELFSINAKYLNKAYEITHIDSSWNDFIKPDYSLVQNETEKVISNYDDHGLNINIKLKKELNKIVY